MSTQNQLFAETLKLVPTNLEGNYGVELPPKGFDPLKADKAALLRHGFPSRSQTEFGNEEKHHLSSTTPTRNSERAARQRLRSRRRGQN